jgi:hypothetical protein
MGRMAGVQFPAEVRDFPQLLSIQTNPTSHPVGIGGSFPSVIWPRHEADCSSPYSAEIRKREKVELYFRSPICLQSIGLK